MNCTKEEGLQLVKKFAKKEFEKIQDIKFPYPNVKDSRCVSECKSLLSKQLSNKTSSPIIRKFHPSMHNANRKGCISNYEYWQLVKNDFEEFKKFYYNRLTRSDWFKEKDNFKYLKIGQVPIDIYYCGLTTSGAAPLPSYFKPMLAKYIVNKYLSKYDTVFDPFSGYSGRMLGVLFNGKNYIGQDINNVTIEESRNIFDFVKPYISTWNTCELKTKDVTKSKGSHDCLFTCSPYGLIEQWGQNIHDYSCDKWIDICLDRFDCEKYVFVTDNKISKYREYIKEDILNTSHWGKNSEHIVVIRR